MAADGEWEHQTVAGAYAKIDAHEDLCAERYKGINEKLGWIMGGLGMTIVGLVSWMAVQLYTLQPLRMAAEQGQRVVVQTGPVTR
jgi:hypothetical protein